MKRMILLFTLLTATAEAKVNVVTTVQTFKSLAESVGGDKVSVTALVGNDVDPHFVDAKLSYASILNKADLLVYVGLELEKGWLPPLLSQARNPNIQTGQAGNLDASTAGIDIKEVGQGNRSQGDIHPVGNPHYWLPPDYASRVAIAIAERLKQIDPNDAAYFDQRVVEFQKQLAVHIAKWAQSGAALRGVKVVTYHKSWTYLLDWLGMVEVGNVEPKPGIDPDSQHILELINTAKKEGAKMVIEESFYPRNTTEQVAKLGGMKLVVLPSDIDGQADYFALIDDIISRLVAAAS
jgi:zinc/manganese transport system substrate-binding protein